MAEPIIEEEIIEEPGLKEKLKQAMVSYGLPALSTVGRALDYPGGVARTAAAGLQEAITGEDLYRPGEMVEALKARPLSGEEYLKRSGVPELGKAKLGPLEMTGRGGLGIAYETLTDPLTYLSLGTVPLAKRLMGGAGKLTEKAGKYAYKAGFKRPDVVSETFSKTPLSDVMLKYGVTGSNKQIQKQSTELVNQLMNKRGQLMAQAQAAGATPDIQRALNPARDFANKLAKHRDEEIADAGKTLLDRIRSKERLGAIPEQVSTKNVPTGLVSQTGEPITKQVSEVTQKAMPPASIEELSDVKSFIYEGIGPEAYNKIKDTPTAKEFEKQLARGIKEEIERSADEAVEGAGKEIAQINDEVGSILSDRKIMNQEALKEVNQNMITPVDALALMGGGPAMLAAKKLADASKRTLLRTKGGMGLMKAGQKTQKASELVGRLERALGRPGEIGMRRGYIGATRQPQSVEEIIEEEVIE